MRARGSSLTQILALSPARVTPHIILLFAFCRQERAAVAQAQPALSASPPHQNINSAMFTAVGPTYSASSLLVTNLHNQTLLAIS